MHKNKSLLTRTTVSIAVLFITALYCSPVLAVWDGNPYNPGATLNPECTPGQTNCSVTTTIPTFQQITDQGFATTNAIRVNGVSSTGDILPLLTDSYGLGTSDARWENLFTSSGVYSSSTLQTADLTVWGDVASDLIPNGTYNLGSAANQWNSLYSTNVSTTNLTALNYVSTSKAYINEAFLVGNATDPLHTLYRVKNQIYDNVTTDLGGTYYDEFSVFATANFSESKPTLSFNSSDLVAITDPSYTGDLSQINGTMSSIQHNGSGRINNMQALIGSAHNKGIGTVNNLRGSWIVYANTGTGTTTNAYGIDIESPSNDASNNNIINAYGLHIQSQNRGVNKWELYSKGTGYSYFGGSIGIGTTKPSTFSLQVAGNVGPSSTNAYDLGSTAYRWRNLWATNATFTSLYVNGTQITGNGGSQTLDQVTALGYVTTNPIRVGGVSSTASILPTSNNLFDLGSAPYAWRNIYASGTIMTTTTRIGQITVQNTELVPTTVSANMLITPPAYNAATENAALYIKTTHRPGMTDFVYGIYGEVDDDQSMVGGSFSKVIHRGRGDGHYVALFNPTGGFGYEAAMFNDQEEGFIATWQGNAGFPESVSNQANSIGFQALLADDNVNPGFVSNYGMFYANNSMGNAVTIRRSRFADVGQIQLRITDTNFGNTYAVYGSGETHLIGVTSTASSLQNNSPQFVLRGSYWDGVQTTSTQVALRGVVDTGNNPNLYIYLGRPNQESLSAIFTSSTLDMQNHGITSVNSLQMYSGGTGLDMQNTDSGNFKSLGFYTTGTLLSSPVDASWNSAFVLNTNGNIVNAKLLSVQSNGNEKLSLSATGQLAITSVTSARLVASDYVSSTYSYVSGEGRFFGAAATVGSPQQTSAQFVLRGHYWDGGQSQPLNSLLKTVIDGANNPYLYFYVGAPSAETLAMLMSASALSLQNHNLVDVGNITMYTGGTGIDSQNTNIAGVKQLGFYTTGTMISAPTDATWNSAFVMKTNGVIANAKLLSVQNNTSNKFVIDLDGNVSSGSLYPLANNQYDIGSAALAWNDVYASGTMRVASSTLFISGDSGLVGIGTTSPDQGKVEVKGGSVCVDTDNDGNAANCIASESDAALKENVKTLEGAMDKIMQLRGVEYDWKTDDPEVLKHYPLISRFANNKHALGLIAQEVEPIVPEAIQIEKIGDAAVQYLQLDYSKFVPLLIEGLKEQQKQLQELKPSLLGEMVDTGALTLDNVLNLGRDSVGKAKINAGSLSVNIRFNNPYTYTPIVNLTPLTRVVGAYWISNIYPNGFDVQLDQIQDIDVMFNWLVVGDKDGKIFTNDPIITPEATPPVTPTEPTVPPEKPIVEPIPPEPTVTPTTSTEPIIPTLEPPLDTTSTVDL